MDIQKLTEVYQRSQGNTDIPVKGQQGSVQTGQTAAEVQQQKAAQMTQQLLNELRPGQVFAGEITDIRNNMLEITLDNQQTIFAKLTDSLEYVIGQRAIFQVKGNTGNVLTLTPYGGAIVANKQLEGQAIARALTAAELPVTDKTAELVKTLMKEQQPIDRQTLQQYGKLMVQFPTSDVSALVTLQKFGIPVTAENINQLQNYQRNEHQILGNIQTIGQGMADLLVQELSANGSEEVNVLFEKLMGAIGESKETDFVQEEQMPNKQVENAEVKNPLPAAGREELSALIREAGHYPELQKAIQDDQASPEQQLQQMQDAWIEQGFPKEHLSNILQNGHFRSILQSALEHKMLIQPEELLKPDGMEKFYKKLVEKVANLEKIAQEYSNGNNGLAKNASDMNQNLRFMQNLNEMMTYIQLPLKLKEQDAHGELYVYTKKNLMAKREGELSAMLHLEMDHLGNVDVMIRMKEQHVTTNFTLETEELLDFIESHLDRLTERLTKKGYDFHAVVKQREQEEKYDFVEDFLKKEDPPVDILRYSFDVRT